MRSVFGGIGGTKSGGYNTAATPRAPMQQAYSSRGRTDPPQRPQRPVDPVKNSPTIGRWVDPLGNSRFYDPGRSGEDDIALWRMAQAGPSVKYGGERGYFKTPDGSVRYIDERGAVRAIDAREAAVMLRSPRTKWIDNPFRNGQWSWDKAAAVQKWLDLFKTGGTPTTPTPPVDPEEEAKKYQDAQYFEDLLAPQGQYNSAIDELTGALTSLTAPLADGRTLYQTYQGAEDRRFQGALSSARNDASMGNLLRSGAFELQRAGLGAEYATNQNKVYQDYGQFKIDALQQERIRQEQWYKQQQALLMQAATQRWLDKQAAAGASNYTSNLLSLERKICLHL
jgi:hypothetical protein